MALLDGIANRLGYARKDTFDSRVKEEIAKRPFTLGSGMVVTDFARTVDSAYAAPIVSGIGNNKAILTEWWINPLWGQPRLVDLKTVRQLARHHIGSMCLEKILDIIAQQDWSIVPKDEKTSEQHTHVEDTKNPTKFYKGSKAPLPQHAHEEENIPTQGIGAQSPKKKPKGNIAPGNNHIDYITEFLQRPNRNNETFDSLIRKLLRGMLETDDGVFVKVFDEYVDINPTNRFDYGTSQFSQPIVDPQQNIRELRGFDPIPDDNAQLTEVFVEDGSSFLKQTDMHGYLLWYWQYSFIVPRRPIRFVPRELCYVMQNPRAGSPYGYSPFESIVDSLTYLIKSAKYNERFYENSAMFPMQIDLPNVKEQRELESWAEWFRKNYMGVEKAYSTLVTQGNTKIIPLSFNNKELQNLEMQQWYFKLVCAKLKVPPSILGFSEGTNRATAGQQSAVFRAEAIKPLIKIIEATINNEIISELDPDGCCEFKFLEFSDLDEEERRSQIHQIYLQNSVMTPNEVREEIDLQPIDGGELTNSQNADQKMQQSHENTKELQQLTPLQPLAGSGKKPSPTHQGNKPEVGKEYIKEYIGVCTSDNEEVYSSNILKHAEHIVMRDGHFVDLAKLFGVTRKQMEVLEETKTMVKAKTKAIEDIKSYTEELKKKHERNKNKTG